MPPVACPYCDSPALEATGDEGVVVCRGCGRSSLRPGGSRGTESAHGVDPAATDVSAPWASRPPVRRAPGEVASWPAALLALLVTAVFYGLLAFAPAGRLSDLFVARGLVPYVITLVSAWALALLVLRLARLRREQAVLERDLVSNGGAGKITPDDASGALIELRRRAQGAEGSFLVARLERALRHFESRRRVVEVVEFLAAESSADEGRVDASYSLVRVFVWVVPTLGFIGTVIGIGAAVGGFSETLEAAASLEGMKESIGSVTGGLGIAFDTTLLALVMSILIMFPASAVQRVEENLIARVDDYCTERLVRFLRDPDEGADDARLVEALARRLAQVLREGSPDVAGGR